MDPLVILGTGFLITSTIDSIIESINCEPWRKRSRIRKRYKKIQKAIRRREEAEKKKESDILGELEGPNRYRIVSNGYKFRIERVNWNFDDQQYMWEGCSFYYNSKDHAAFKTIKKAQECVDYQVNKDRKTSGTWKPIKENEG